MSDYYPYAKVERVHYNMFFKWQATVYIGPGTETHYGFYDKNFLSQREAIGWAKVELAYPMREGIKIPRAYRPGVKIEPITIRPGDTNE